METPRGFGTASALVLSWEKGSVRDTLTHKEKLSGKLKFRTCKTMPILRSTKVEVQLPNSVGNVFRNCWKPGFTDVRVKAKVSATVVVGFEAVRRPL